ncbi:MAG: response regulator transcription factor [Myxococcota bacterium]
MDIAQGPVRIQVVEDDPVIGEDLADCLKQLGYQPLPRVADLATALLAIEREKPHIALLDIKLAGHGDGIELARMIRAKQFELALIFLTSFSDRETIDRAVQVRPAGYLIKPFSQDAVYAAVEMAFQSVSTNSESPSGIQHGSKLKRVLAFMEKNLERNLTLLELADEAGLSRNHFGRLFREGIGTTPYKYLVQRRMVKARRLLETTDRPIIEVAVEVGYESQAYFSTVFKKECGVTPAAYRRDRRAS